jgi:osmotically-inducible protein OsmY
MRIPIVLIGTTSLWLAAAASAQSGVDDAAAAANGTAHVAGLLPTDADLETQLNHELRATGITPRIEDGVATLEGTVPSEADRDRAAQIARRAPGVTDVRNRLVVIPEASVAVHAGVPLAAAVDTAVSARLAADPRFAGRRIAVRSSSRNAVTLTGEVGSEVDKAVAGRIAADTDSVSEVRNRLVVRPD